MYTLHTIVKQNINIIILTCTLTLFISSSELLLISTLIGISGKALKTLSSKGILRSPFFAMQVTPGEKNLYINQ